MFYELADLVHNHIALRAYELIWNIIFWSNNFEVIDILRVKWLLIFKSV